MKIPLTKATIENDDLKCMSSALYKRAISQNDLTEVFERNYSKFIGTAGSVATNSCTSAIILALATLNIKKEQEVILPSYTCLAVLNAVIQYGVRPILADNSYDTDNMDFNIKPDSVKNLITNKTGAIIVPHMFGVPADIDDIIKMNIPVVEDITLSLGTFYKDRPVGSWGDISVCSFYNSKMISCGEGGMLSSKRSDLYERAFYLNGWEKEQASMRLKKKNEFNYELRYNFRMSGIAASLGISQLEKLPIFIKKRCSIAKKFTSVLSNIRRLKLPKKTNKQNAFFRYLIALENRNISSIIQKFANHGIEVGRGVYPPLHWFFKLDKTKFSGAEKAVDTLLSIPIYPNLNNEQINYILEYTKNILTEKI